MSGNLVSELKGLGEELVEAERAKLAIEEKLAVLRKKYQEASEVMSQIVVALENIKPPPTVTPVTSLVADEVVLRLLREASIDSVEQLCGYTKNELFKHMGPGPIEQLEEALAVLGKTFKANGNGKP